MRHPAFACFWFSRTLSTSAYQMQAVAIGWAMYALTDSAYALGLVGLAQFLPLLLLTPAVGQAADRFDRRRIAAICQAIEAGGAVILLLGVAGGWLGEGLLFGIVVILASARAFEGPSLAALIPGLVPPALLQPATAWSASANQTASILGPALGGLLYAVSPGLVFGFAACCFAAAGVAASLIRLERPAPKREKASFASAFHGLAFLRARPVLLGTISLDMVAVLLGGAAALFPIYARDILMTGPWGLGLLRAAPAVGALAMSVVLAHVRLRHHAGRLLFGAVMLFGAMTVVFGLSRWLPLSLAALVVLGAADVVSVVIRFALVQSRTPDAMRGRVSAVNALFVGTSNQLGEFESGITAGLFGAVPAAVLGGVGTVLVALAWMRLFPDLREIDSLEPPVPR
jgi:MFS family permease